MSITIVAVPAEDDLVWKVSSEKVPHMTLLFLGDSDNPQHIVDYTQHAVKTSLSRFSMDVDRRGSLGPDDADVLFFETGTNWGYRGIAAFRESLLRDNVIKAAYDAQSQFPEWTPHVTLGYPETPAKEIDPEVSRFYSVRFDRIEVWVGDYTGPTFELKREEFDVAMSDAHKSTDFVEAFLSHYGIKGMKWGVRKSRDREPAHPDASNAKDSLKRVKKSGTQALSNKDLKDLVKRMQLEQQFSELTGKKRKSHPINQGTDVVKEALGTARTISDVYKMTAPVFRLGVKLAKTK